MASLSQGQQELRPDGSSFIKRLQQGANSPHPLGGVELRSLRPVKRDEPDFPDLFVSERG
ncbi:hypothetical protein NDA01_25745 [Trichocoleus desertorum AS-A10]|uniref:hypothetical protein n=1 Tax=Trichocoleus desertorum TaxID=1481672 RepID=UPI003299360B